MAKAFWFEKFFIEINTYFIGQANTDTNNIQIIQISDLHLQSINFQLRQLAKKINEIHPSLILFTGDAIDKNENLSLLNDFLQLLNINIRKVAILGNWEYWGRVDLIQLKEIYAANNGALLVNECRQFFLQNKTITITGLDDLIGGNADIDLATAQFIPSDYHIILNHCPQYSEHIAKNIQKGIPVDFIASGHTHGGQINLLGYIPFLPAGSGRYVKGWYREIVPNMYVSKGIGTSILPIRFGARAEISVFNFVA